MENIGAFDAKTHLSALLERVAKGERFTITRHGTPVAHLVPVTRRDPEQVTAVVQRMQDIAAGLTLAGDWRDFRDAGRKW